MSAHTKFHECHDDCPTSHLLHLLGADWDWIETELERRIALLRDACTIAMLGCDQPVKEQLRKALEETR